VIFSVIEVTDGEEEENITKLALATGNGKNMGFVDVVENKENGHAKLRGQLLFGFCKIDLVF
jgi:hypothetical protein